VKGECEEAFLADLYTFAGTVRLTQSDQIRHGNTRGEDGISRAQPFPHPTMGPSVPNISGPPTYVQAP